MSEYLDDLIRWEGLVVHLYRDSRGFMTTGIGHLVPDLAAAQQLPWFVGDRPATADEIREDVRRIANVTNGAKAAAYADCTFCRMTVGAVRELAEQRLEDEFLPGLRLWLPGFESLPRDARRVLVDMAWNLGLKGLRQFHRLQEAVRIRDWPAASVNCHVRTSRDDRNDWRAHLLLAAGHP